MYTNLKVEFKNFDKKSKNLFFCSFCGIPYITYEDFNLSKKWDGACQECYLTFIEARKLSWKEGWRPDKETLEEYIYNRKKLLQEKK